MDEVMMYKYSRITKQIIRAFYMVYNELGYGFLEKVYENALMIELRKIGLKAEQQFVIKVFYDGVDVGDYYADIVVENRIIVELKAKKTLVDKDEAQLLNYLKATEFEVGLLLNFGPEPEVKRKAFDNSRK
ncbi:MAG: GxxExxY protein [Fidelibacterota bacterium]